MAACGDFLDMAGILALRVRIEIVAKQGAAFVVNLLLVVFLGN